MLWDLSPAVTERIGVWPGDTPLRREVLADVAAGDNYTLSTLHGTVHLGAHADAWSHIVDGAPAAEAMPLDAYVGPCQVVAVDVGRDGVVRPADLPGTVTAQRVLLATGTYPDPDRFTTDFAALSAELVHHLADRGCRLVGIDTPSIDPFASKQLPAHHACVDREVAILEGLVLADVPSGHYELAAAPLRLAGFDASPVRAILRSE